MRVPESNSMYMSLYDILTSIFRNIHSDAIEKKHAWPQVLLQDAVSTEHFAVQPGDFGENVRHAQQAVFTRQEQEARFRVKFVIKRSVRTFQCRDGLNALQHSWKSLRASSLQL